MTIGRYYDIQEILGNDWCRRAVKTGLLLVELGWMTKEEYKDYWKLNFQFNHIHGDDTGKTRILAEVGW